jgi:hypothetical protein
VAAVAAVVVAVTGLGYFVLRPGSAHPASLVLASPTGDVATASTAPNASGSPGATSGAASPTASGAASSPGATAGSSRTTTTTARATTSTTTRSTTTRAQAAATTSARTSASCTAPVFTTSDTNGGWSTAGYYVHNNVWNASEAGPETLHACSARNWYVVSNQRNLSSNPGSVKSYPNVHKDYSGERISSYSHITSTFAATSPHVGIYNVAYDLWLNGVADSGSTEVMIWTENYKQVPAGSKVTTVSFGGVSYAVWKSSDNSYIAFVPSKVMTSGSLDLLQMLTWLMSKGWLPNDSTMGQICFGIEVVSTDGAEATFSVTDFSVSDG